MNQEIQFKQGDIVIYPTHGVGQIISEESETIAGFQVSVFLVHFEKAKMTLRVPVKRAKASGLRHLSTKTEIEQVLQILKTPARSNKNLMWSKRAQEFENKINSGSIHSLAEVVRDLYKKDNFDRSYSERMIYEQAFSRLSDEICAVEALKLEEVMDKILFILEEKAA